jgi:glutamate 5-kinase
MFSGRTWDSYGARTHSGAYAINIWPALRPRVKAVKFNRTLELLTSNNHNSATEAPAWVRSARRVVIKLGTNVVTGGEHRFSTKQVVPLVKDIVKFKKSGRQVVLVSSGAIGLGAESLGISNDRLKNLQMRQVCAAVGQGLLINSYERIFGRHKVKVAQLLLTEADFYGWKSYSNLRHALDRLLKLGVVPIINENDAVSTEEIEYLGDTSKRVFSDNDKLAALVTSRLDADALIILTNVDGLQNRLLDNEVLPMVLSVGKELKALAAGPSAKGRGGMITKLEAAEIATRTGAVAVIANGSQPNILSRLFAGESVGTLFLPTTSRLKGKRQWIAYAGVPSGRLVVNDGARDAILKKKASLLVAGVVRINQPFAAHEIVSIADDRGREFARGLSACASSEVKTLVQNKNRSISERLAAKTHVLIRRNNIVILE